jgi:hypothetical protein
VVRVLDIVDPDLEWTHLDPNLDDPEPQTCHGRGELEAALQRLAERGLQAHLEDVNGRGERVMVVVHPPASTLAGSATPTAATTPCSPCGRDASSPPRDCHDRDEALRYAGIG